MKPFYQDEYATIYHGSSEGVKSADVIVLDPPDYIGNLKDYECKTLIVFCGKRVIEYIRQLPKRKLHLIGCNRLHAITPRLAISNDYVLVFGESQIGFRGALYNVLSFEERLHPWERPENLMRRILQETKGDILDPFMGSGSTLVVGSKLKRKCIGYEIEENFCQITARRLEEVR